MKKNKLSRSRKLIFMTLFMLIVVTIIIGMFFSNKAGAATCSACGENVTITHDSNYHVKKCNNPDCYVYGTEYSTALKKAVVPYNSESHRIKITCPDCSSYVDWGAIAKCIGYEKHSSGGNCETCGQKLVTHKVTTTYPSNYNGTHKVIETCSYFNCNRKTYTVYSGASCTGGAHPNGTCDYCGYKYQTHTVTRIGNGDGRTHTIKCSYCGNMGTENHTYSTYTNNGDGTHSSVCAGCGYKLTEVHRGATHDNGGKCTASGCNAQYETHEATETIVDYTDKTETKHTPLYKCTHEGCTSTVKGTAANHVGGIHSNDGKCTTCTHKYQTHEQSTTIKEYKKAQSGHTPVYKCTEGTCDFTYDGEEALHTGATHDNDGICIVEGCGYQYEIHQATTAVTEYVDVTETQHTPVYTCSFEGCTSTVKGAAEEHTGGTHENGGVCTLCKKQYQNHGQSTEIVDYIKHEDLHIELYKCTEPTCTKLLIGLSELHKGGAHENDGKCTVCDYQYQIHGVSDEFARHEITETGHTELYKCTFTGCEGTHKVGEEEPHKGGTHQNDGICTICSHKYQTHEKTTEIAKYMIDETVHMVLYKCSHPGCTTTYPGTAEDHKGGTHENGGKCTVCEYQYQAHNASEEVAEYEITETGHTPKYKCTYEGCEGTHLGEEEAHKGGNHENDGICTVCGEKYQTHGKSEEIKEYQPTENGHKPIYECTHPDCDETYEGEEEAHSGATHENGGKCEKCEEVYEEHGKADEATDYELTDNGHKPIYDCTNEDCNETYEGEEEPHNVEEWTDDGNGVHSGECTECGEEVTEEHDYGEDGKCKDCDAIIPEDECEHTYIIEKNETHHWNFCPKCRTTKEGSFELHKYEEYTVNEDGTHSATCTVCQYELIEKHNYEEDGKCEDCAERIPAEECKHAYEMKHDETQHWKFCPKCETIEEETKGNHTYGKYVDNGDGTHSRTCTICEYKQTEQHNEDCDKCKEKESTSGSGDNATNGDNTTADKEIPKAGIQNMIIGLIASIGVLAIITRFKMKKYKDI